MQNSVHQFLIKYKNFPLEIDAKNVPLLFFMLDVTLGLPSLHGSKNNIFKLRN